MTIAATARVSWSPTCDAPTQTRPPSTRERRSGRPGVSQPTSLRRLRPGGGVSGLDGWVGSRRRARVYGDAMCGIAGAFRLDGAGAPALPEHVLRPMTDVMAYRGPDDAGYVSGRRLLARRAAALDHRRRGRPPAVRRRARPRLGRPERRDLQPRRAPRGARGARPRPAQPLRHRGAPAPLRGARPGARRAPARDVRRRGLGPGRAPRRADPRPARASSRSTTRSPATCVVFGSELKCVLASGLVSDELDPEAIAAYLTLGYVPGPMTPLRQVRKLGPGERLVVRGRRAPRLERWWQLPRARARPDARARRRSGPRSCSTSSTSRCGCA